jgi:hypothetical protein
MMINERICWKNKVLYALVLLCSSTLTTFGQTDITNDYVCDSIVISYMPYSSRGNFLISENEFRISSNSLKKSLTLYDTFKLNDILSAAQMGVSDTLKDGKINVYVLIDVYKKSDIEETIIMDCNGIIRFKTKDEMRFYNQLLSRKINELTNQISVECGMP